MKIDISKTRISEESKVRLIKLAIGLVEVGCMSPLTITLSRHDWNMLLFPRRWVMAFESDPPEPPRLSVEEAYGTEVDFKFAPLLITIKCHDT